MSSPRAWLRGKGYPFRGRSTDVDRSNVLRLLAGVALAAVFVGAISAYVLTSGLNTPEPCPLEFYVEPLNTTAGWFYRVAGVAGEPRPLADYSAVFFTLTTPDSHGNQDRVVRWEGPLPDLLGGQGNFSFDDRGTQAGRLDASGDYFWAASWHNLWVLRAGTLVGGTVGCI